MGKIYKWFISKIIVTFNIISSFYWQIIYDNYKGKYCIHKTFRFNGKNIELYGDGEIIVGENSYLGSYSWIQSVKGFKVLIGRNCSLSHFVHVYTSNHYSNKDFSKDNRLKSGNVIIGDYCWIGIKTSIMGPVIIGEHSVVGANSLVTRDIPPHSISVGVPAKVIKFKSYLSKEDQYKYALNFKDVISESLKIQLGIN